MTTPIFLTLEDVLEIHALQIRIFGGAEGLRDPGLLESAVAQAQASSGGVFLHDGLHAMAAAYLFHLVQNHPFIDGNKRVGLHAALAFLVANGVEIPTPAPEVYELTLEVASSKVSKEEVATRLRVLFVAR